MTEQQGWRSLFRGYAQRAEQDAQKREREREREIWYEEQARRVMELVREIATERAAEFERETGSVVDVKWPSRPPINVSPQGPFMSFMSLTLGERELHLYSHRVPKQAPVIHFVVMGEARGHRERPQLASHAGCRIDQRKEGGFLLTDLRVGHDEGASVLSVDDVVFRAFELLLSR